MNAKFINDLHHLGRDKLLIFDLDETLIYSSDFMLDRPPDFNVGDYFVYVRPGLEILLSTCSRLYKLAVWTFGSHNYAAEVVRKIFFF
ncbi:MAG: HAD family hydrolase [Flammeovirgaceae bacterium]